MLPSALLSIPQITGPVATPRTAEVLRVRAGTSLAFVIAFTLASFGLYWDILWHTYLGRDRFLTPPHVLLYLGVAGAGLSVLASILYESFVVRDDAAPVFLGFRGLRGMFVAGFGVLTIVIAAPFDNWWHSLYGVDVTIWAPFHLMGLFGASIGVIGIAYALASVARSMRGEGRTWLEYGLYEWLLFYDLAAGIALVTIIANPGLRVVPLIGGESFPTLTAPLVAAAPLTFLLVAAVTYSERSTASLVVLGIFIARQAIYTVLGPALTTLGAALYHIDYRVADFRPQLTLSSAVLLLALVPGAAAITYMTRKYRITNSGGALATIVFAIGVIWWVAAAQTVNIPLPNLVVPPLAPGQLISALPVTIIIVSILGAIGTAMGRGFGTLLRAE